MMQRNAPITSTNEAVEANKIAVVGLAGRFPGAQTIAQFWDNLCAGVEARTTFSDETLAQYLSPDLLQDPAYVRAGFVLDQVADFDADFFDFTGRQAQITDPQQRIFLECVWEALESAGIDLAQSEQLIGLYAGASQSTYATNNPTQPSNSMVESLPLLIGNDKDYLATQTAYRLNLQGPCMTIQSACSTGLVAVHVACQSLLNFECDVAVAGAVTVRLPQDRGYLFEDGGILAADGHCRAFDAAATGTVFGSGAGVVVLKRLGDALADGDQIWAVIRGSAINNDGARKFNFTTSSPMGQMGVISEAWNMAGVTPEMLTYIETHGTGTQVGDPIEVDTLASLFAAADTTEKFCAIGSVKTNVGHLESAAGITGLIKTVLALHHRQLPPSLHFERPNPKINFADMPLYVNTTLRDWETTRLPRCAGVSSFGIGGTNAHLVLEEAPNQSRAEEQAAPPNTQRPQLLTLSAKTEPALQDLARRYAAFLANTTATDLADICYTSHIGRTHFAHRLSAVGTSPQQLSETLLAYAKNEAVSGINHGVVLPNPTGTAAPKRIAFLFTGQGSQYLEMGRELYAEEPCFRTVLERCDRVFQQVHGRSLLELLYPATPPAHNDLMDSHPCGQAANFALECALTDLWRSWGIQPDIVLGHSLGDFAAAYTAGVLSLEDGLRLVTARGRLMEEALGSMLSVLASEAEVAPFLAAHSAVTVGVINGPRSVVISGAHEAVAAVDAALQAAGFKTRKLAIPVAAHSPMLDPVLDAFEATVRTVSLQHPQLAVVSSMTGQLISAELTDPVYWRKHLRNTVRFADGVQTLLEQGCTVFLEIGPKPTLLGMVEQNLDEMAGKQDDKLSSLTTGGTVEGSVIPSPPHPVMLPSLREGQSDRRQLLNALGTLYGQGVAIDWNKFDDQPQRHKLLLPTYPFQRRRYWVERPKKRATTALRPLIDKMVRLPLHQELLFESEFSVEAMPFLADHRVYDRIVSPAACQLAMLLAAADLALSPAASTAVNNAESTRGGLALTDILFPQALVIPDEGQRLVQAVLGPEQATGQPMAIQGHTPHYVAQLVSSTPAQLPDDDEAAAIHYHLTGFVTGSASSTRSGPTANANVDLAQLQQSCTEATDLATFYADLANTQVILGQSFRWIQSMWHNPIASAATDEGPQAEALACLVCPESIASTTEYLLHPGLLDSCFQVAGATRKAGLTGSETLLPFALEALHLHRAATGNTWWCHAIQVDQYKWDIALLDETGVLVASIRGFELRAASSNAIGAPLLRKDWLHTLHWEPSPIAAVPEAAPLPHCWLLVGADAEWTTELAAQLESTGPVVQTPAEENAIRRVVTEIDKQYQSVRVVYCAIDRQSPAAPPERTLALCGGLLHLTQALIDTTVAASLWVVTQGTQVVSEAPVPQPHTDRHKGDPGETAAAGALWGFVRTLAQEQPQLNAVCIDVETGVTAEDIAELLRQEIRNGRAGQQENDPTALQVAYRNQSRYVARLAPWQGAALDPATPMRLQLQDYGSFEQLTFVPLTRRQPGPGEIEVEVKAAGLNFRDVLNALGMLKEYYAAELGITQAKDVGLGFECAGIITAVGEGVTEWAVGDRVMGMGTAEGTFANYLTLPAGNMTRIPSHLSYAEAATIPLTFLTAWYGLVELGQLQAGERVLIHASAGGVGQAAVQIAQMLGAEVIGTASPGKWPFLRRQGVAHIYNSRTLNFAEEIMELTNGRGVDVVFNSLNGDFIERSFAVLGQRGRFVEIGKLGIWSREQVAEQRPDVAYYPYDLGEETAKTPSLYPALWDVINSRLTAGALQPLPHVSFPARQSVEAFRYMQQAKQMGKLILDFALPQPVTLTAEATYLITGGLGGLGLQIAQQLIEDGAKQLILSSRKGVTTDEQRALLAQMADAGAEIHVVAADIAKREEVQALLETCRSIAPLRGIVHTAGVLDDGVVAEQTVARLARVMRSKVDGLWHLHTLSQALELDFLVSFSSAAALLGSAGQSNYAAANAFMDTLMQQRRNQGLPGLSINWGAWAEVGLAAHLQERMKAQGMKMISPQQGRQLFHYLLQQPVAQVGVLPFTAHQPAATNATGAQTQQLQLRDVLAELESAERYQHLEAYVRSQIAVVLGLQETTPIDPRTRLFDFGLDSLMAVEVKNKLATGLACPLRSTLLFDYPTLEVLVPYLLQDILGFDAEEPTRATGPAVTNGQATAAASELAALSEDALDELLSQELAFLSEG